jgi:transposase
VRDDRPFAGPDPPAAVFFYSRNRGGEHPARHLADYADILQADAYAGFGDLYHGKRKPGPITEAACWSHSRRKFFELADLRKAPLAVDAVRRINELFAIERSINGRTADDAWRRAGGKVGLLLPISKNGCARSVPTCRVATISPRPWTTYSSAGRLSPGSSTTAASASARVVLRSQNRRLGADFLGCLLQASTIRS